MLVVVDPDGDLSESDETNNTGYTSASVTPVSNTAVDSTDTSAWCSDSSRDIFYASTISIASETSDPEVTAKFRKCDGSSLSEDKSCHVRVGSYTGSYSSSLDRVSFTWSSGSTSKTVSWNAWTSASSFESASSGEVKEFYLICEEDGGDWNHWRSENPIVIEVE